MTPPTSADELVERLGMQPIAGEGGWWAPGPRTPELSCITALVADTEDGFSALHVLTIHEGWQWLDGDPLRLTRLYPDGTGDTVTLGADNPQAVVPAGVWQGARTLGGWTLFACWCTPQFTDDCFTLGDRTSLIEQYPAYAATVADLTRVTAPATPSKAT